jgi:D-amino-acid dehydrogenase
MKKVDVVVLGAGVVGVCCAIQLQSRGRSVLLVDRRSPGYETSFGNAGLVQREGVFPYGFPHNFKALFRYGFNRAIDARYHLLALPKIAPFLWKYWWHSRPARHREIASNYARLIELCVVEHDALIDKSGAGALVRRNGWIKLFRSERERDLRLTEAAGWKRDFGIQYAALNTADLEREEPFLAPVLVGGLHFTQPIWTSDPHGLVSHYVRLFERIGGQVAQGNALSLESTSEGWQVRTAAGLVQGGSVVVALGPWSDTLTSRLGYDFPLAVKRGYHMHYHAAAGAKLNHPVLDHERGYFLAPMQQGVRLTTGAEFALRDAMRTPVQLDRAEPVARNLFPLGERLDRDPWMGARPCTPDMMPIIGPGLKHRDLWFAFGHAHHGLTLGPVTGRVISEMVTGETPVVDPTPYRADRF